MCKYNYFNVKKQTAGGENFENFRCQICNFVKETLILEDQNFKNFPCGAICKLGFSPSQGFHHYIII